MNESRLINLTGWGVFAVSLIAYLLTVAPTASFWDCSEFIACSNELEVTHPPGAPLFLLLGRIMSILSFGQVTEVAFMVNLLSVLASAFTALFTCWTAMILARHGLEKTAWDDQSRIIGLIGVGVVAGLSCAFADSVWFNAVEAEVYAMSSFFTALVVWLIFKWEARADEPDNLRWIILIAYMMGLSIGVHLLNLLTIPALAMVYYFRKFEPSWKGFFATMGISVALLIIIQYGIIQYMFSLAWEFEKVFTGTMTREGEVVGGIGLPVGTGAGFFALLLVSLLVGLIIYSQRKAKIILNTVVVGITVIIIGFSSYTLIYMRSNVDPPVDMNNPENLLTFLSYMRREQYGDRPLLRGHLYNSELERDSRGYPQYDSKGMKYMLVDGKDRYVEDEERLAPKYKKEDIFWFPRMYDPGHYNAGPFGYINYVTDKGADPANPQDDNPSKADDLAFFFDYQLNHMYFRYFMWNFAGRQSDIKEAPWESGLLWDRTSTNNKANNHFYFIPLLLGLMGLVWHAIQDKRHASIIGMLFFFTGIAIIIYLNQWPEQPRERDYSFAGSFQTFAIWIGFGVLFLMEWLKGSLRQYASWVAIAIAISAPLIMAFQGWDDHTRKGRWVDIEFAKNLLNSCEENAILFTGGDNDTFSLWYMQEVEGYRTDVRIVNLELLISDWYVDQLKQEKNGAMPVPISIPKEEYMGESGLVIYNFPSREIKLPSHKDHLLEQEIFSVREAELCPDTMAWNFKARGNSRNPYILRKDAMVINILSNVADEKWERPVYFANTMGSSSWLGLQDFFRLEGMAFRVLPLRKSDQTINDIYYGRIDQNRMREVLTNKFLYTGLDDPSVNLDEHIRQVVINNYRNAFYRLANTYSSDVGDWYLEREQLQFLMDQGQVDQDSAGKRIQSLSNQINARQLLVQEIFDFMEEKMPSEVTEMPLYLSAYIAQVYGDAAMEEEAVDKLKSISEQALAEIERMTSNGQRIGNGNMSLRIAVLAIQSLLVYDRNEEAQEIANKLEPVIGISAQDLLNQLQQQPEGNN